MLNEGKVGKGIHLCCGTEAGELMLFGGNYKFFSIWGHGFQVGASPNSKIPYSRKKTDQPQHLHFFFEPIWK